MDKIKRFRNAQTQSFEDFFNFVTDRGICEYCDSYQDCKEAMGEENLEYLSGNGCGAFDTSVERIKKAFLLEKCIPIGT
jgi:hypothetical protein